MSAGKKSTSEKLRVFLQKLDQVETKSLMRRLTQIYGWTAKQALAAIMRYLMFLCLSHLYPHQFLVPTPEMDAVWHCHILHTRKYRNDCMFLFGCYLDHEPEEESEEISSQPTSDLDVAFAHTKTLFENHFGAGSFERIPLNCDDQTSLTQKQQNAFTSEHYLVASKEIACGRPAACGIVRRQHLKPLFK